MLIKGFRLVPLGLYPWVLGDFQRTLGDYIGPYKRYIRARLGKPVRGTTLGVRLRRTPHPVIVVY